MLKNLTAVVLLFLNLCSIRNKPEINNPSSGPNSSMKTYYPIAGVEPDISKWIPNTDYVFYFTRATLPALYIALNMFTHMKPSFLYLERQGIYDITYLPAHVQELASGGSFGQGLEEVKNKVRELQAGNPNATYTFFVEDIRAELLVSLFFENGVNEDRVILRLLSDGTQTYTSFKRAYGGPDGKLIWDRDIKNISAVYEQYKKVNSEATAIGSWCSIFPVIPFVSKNAALILQWPELFGTKDLALYTVLAVQKDRNIWKFNPYKLYTSLTSDNQRALKNMLKLTQTYTELGGKTIEQALIDTGKDNIIITGTNPYGNQTDQYINLVKQHYGARYAYFFKPHPAAIHNPNGGGGLSHYRGVFLWKQYYGFTPIRYQ